eukprot:3039981-Amphidinium_carterae.2
MLLATSNKSLHHSAPKSKFVIHWKRQGRIIAVCVIESAATIDKANRPIFGLSSATSDEGGKIKRKQHTQVSVDKVCHMVHQHVTTYTCKFKLSFNTNRSNLVPSRAATVEGSRAVNW